MFCKVGVLKNFANFRGNHVSLLNKIASLRACNFIKKRLQHVFSREIFKNTFFYRTPMVSASASCKTLSEFASLSVFVCSNQDV